MKNRCPQVYWCTPVMIADFRRPFNTVFKHFQQHFLRQLSDGSQSVLFPEYLGLNCSHSGLKLLYKHSSYYEVPQYFQISSRDVC